MSADVIAMRREADDIARRRTDAISRHPAGTARPPHAALLHRIANLITAEDLPPARVTIRGSEVLIDASSEGQVENTVRRWAQALDLLVTQVAYDLDNGVAATLWSTSGYDGTGVWWHIAGAEPVAAVAP